MADKAPETGQQASDTDQPKAADAGALRISRRTLLQGATALATAPSKLGTIRQLAQLGSTEVVASAIDTMIANMPFPAGKLLTTAFCHAAQSQHLALSYLLNYGPPPSAPRPRDTTRVLDQCEIDALLGFDGIDFVANMENPMGIWENDCRDSPETKLANSPRNGYLSFIQQFDVSDDRIIPAINCSDSFAITAECQYRDGSISQKYWDFHLSLKTKLFPYWLTNMQSQTIRNVPLDDQRIVPDIATPMTQVCAQGIYDTLSKISRQYTQEIDALSRIMDSITDDTNWQQPSCKRHITPGEYVRYHNLTQRVQQAFKVEFEKLAMQYKNPLLSTIEAYFLQCPTEFFPRNNLHEYRFMSEAQEMPSPDIGRLYPQYRDAREEENMLRSRLVAMSVALENQKSQSQRLGYEILAALENRMVPILLPRIMSGMEISDEILFSILTETMEQWSLSSAMQDPSVDTTVLPDDLLTQCLVKAMRHVGRKSVDEIPRDEPLMIEHGSDNTTSTQTKTDPSQPGEGLLSSAEADG